MIKKVLLLLLLLILPISVYAKEANLELKNIEKIEASSDAVEVSPPTIENSTLSYNLKFTNTNEFIKYKLEIINHDDIDYEIDLKSDDDYLSYEISEKEIGANKTTIKFLYGDIEFIKFFTSAKQKEQLNVGRPVPMEMEIIGTPSINRWRDRETKQIVIKEWEIK